MLNETSISLNQHNELIRLLTNTEELLRNQGIQVKPSNNALISSLPLDVVERASGVLKGIYDSYVSSSSSDEVKPAELEKLFLKRALDRFGFYIEDSFWDIVEDGDLIEVYSSNMTQLYRSRSFFEITGYSLLDLTANEWYNLFERPASIQKMMMDVVTGVLAQPSNRPSRIDIPTHLMKERCDVGFVEPPISRAVEVQFKYIMPLKRHPLKPADGFIVTCKARLIALGEDTRNIDFI